MPQKLTDVREVLVVVAAAESVGEVSFAHGLEDNAGNDLTSDFIEAELQAQDDWQEPTFWQHGVSRPSATNTRVWVRTSVNPGPGDWTFQLRVTSAYMHSILSDDHTV